MHPIYGPRRRSDSRKIGHCRFRPHLGADSLRQDGVYNWPDAFDVVNEASHQPVPGCEETGRPKSIQESADQQLVPVVTRGPLIQQSQRCPRKVTASVTARALAIPTGRKYGGQSMTAGASPSATSTFGQDVTVYHLFGTGDRSKMTSQPSDQGEGLVITFRLDCLPRQAVTEGPRVLPVRQAEVRHHP